MSSGRLNALAIALFLTTQAEAQCPPVGFVNISEAVMGRQNPSLNATIPVRQADGSFRGLAVQGTPPNATVIGTMPDFQQSFFNCSAAAGRTAQSVPGRPNLRDDLLGTLSLNPLVTDLIGDGANLSGFGVYPYAGQQNVLQSVIVNPGGSQTLASHATGTTGPDSILVGDFNGDGHRDIAVVNSPDTGNGSVSIFLGTGTASLLQAAVNYPVGRNPRGATAFDFNGDGRPDIAVANRQSNTVSVLINNGNGTFRAAVNYPVSFPSAVVAADVTGDGRADLIVGGGGVLAVLGGNPDGTFRPAISTAFEFNPVGIAVGDFNKDGRLDVAVGNLQAYTIVVLYGAGNGTFPNRRAYLAGDPMDNSQIHLFALDFDGDTNLDIVIAEGHPDLLIPPPYSKSVKVLFNRGDGTFLGAPSYSTDTQLRQMASGDFNGDGKLDIVINANSGLSLFLGTGSGFQDAITVPVLDQGFTVLLGSVAAGDFNGDGKLDLATATLSSSNVGLFTLLGNGNGSFQPAVKVATIGQTQGLAAGDLNGDGKIDLVAAQSALGTPLTYVLVFLGTGSGTFQNPAQLNVGSNPVSVQLADLNGDGRLDIIATCGGTFGSTTDLGGVAVALGNGNGTFQAASLLPAGVNPSFTGVGDVTGDGRPELFTSASTGGSGSYKVYEFLNQGNGTFQAPVLLTTDFGPSGIVVGDFNGDGKNDLIVGHCCGETDGGAYVGNGNGTFQAEIPLKIGASSLVIAADLNGDGKLDLVASNPDGRSIAALFNLAGALPGTACTFSLSRAGATAAASGDAAGVVVRPSAASCTWTASSTVAWINVSPAQHVGPGVALLSIAANPTTGPRTGTAIVAGLPFSVTQPAFGCAFTVNPQTLSFTSGFSSQDTGVTTGALCQWTPQVSASWLSTSGFGPGPATLSVTAFGNNGSLPRTATVNIGGAVIQAAQNAATPIQVFADVPVSHPYFNFISLLRERAITSGCTTANYCPDDNTTRGQMAVFIIRGVLGTEDFSFPQTPFFTDVPADHPYFKYVQKLREMGITSGCTATAYCVNDAVTRGQMAVFIIRAATGLTAADPLPVPGAPFFTDVPAGHPYFSYIQAMRIRGITTGCTANTYCPDAPITRGQMAVFIIRGL